ncbi:putative small auxin-up RNA [Rosa chinensis]|uniref:Putative small auxin-up RNA n=1 Tax=Rosa chinensis TaxID=74649 RepID=A0A2P6RTC6_ROSCH|nr:putative small auxin-up RNA [Rosa chinensis]
MGFRLPGIASTKTSDIPKGYFAVLLERKDPTLENQKKRFVVPISYLNQPLFQDLLKLKKNLDTIIQWAVSQFLAVKTPSLISLPA